MIESIQYAPTAVSFSGVCQLYTSRDFWLQADTAGVKLWLLTGT